MKTSNRHSVQPAVANFRQWSRKGYAVFASLGRTVRIATLKTAVTSVLTGKNGTSVNLFPVMAVVDDEVNDLECSSGEPLDVELTLCQLVMAVVMPQPAIAACDACVNIPFNNINPVGRCQRGFLFDIILML
jgi:hypothetical protein